MERCEIKAIIFKKYNDHIEARNKNVQWSTQIDSLTDRDDGSSPDLYPINEKDAHALIQSYSDGCCLLFTKDRFGLHQFTILTKKIESSSRVC